MTERQNVSVPVTHAQIVVERTPASGTPAPGAMNDQAREVRIPLTEEKVSVEKQPVVTEQVPVAKREVEGTEPVQEELKHEELKIASEGELTPEEREALRRGEKSRRAA